MILIIVTTIVSFFISFILLPWLIDGLRERGIIVRDHYKRGRVYIPTQGGLIILFMSILMVTLFPLIIRIVEKFELAVGYYPPERPLYVPEVTTAITLTILGFGFFGLLDDYINIRRPLKIILPFIFTIPMAMLTYKFSFEVPLYGHYPHHTHVPLPLFELVPANIIYGYIVVPIYLVVGANLVNMHSGFNGLATGTASILLVAVIIKSILFGQSTIIVVVGAILGAGLALWCFNKYPARVMEGNLTALTLGATISAGIVVQGFIYSGLIMFLPHIINFLLYVYWRIQHYRYPYEPKYKLVKYGSVRADGTLVVPNKYTLKWIFPYYCRQMTEPKATGLMYLLTLACAVVGVALPW